MYRILAAIVLAAFASGGLMAQTAAKTKRVPVKAPATTKSKRTVKASAKSKAKAKAAPRRWVQSQPTPERYKEIQQALAGKGYFGGVADGNWGNDSVDALKRFQKDQNLETDGKLGSLALIALGLGPKRGEAGPAAETSPPDSSR